MHTCMRMARRPAPQVTKKEEAKAKQAGFGSKVALEKSKNKFMVGGIVLSIRMANFGWAHPNRVVSQAVFQKNAAGHPKLEAEREVRASPWEFALIASRLDASRVPKKTVKTKLKKKTKEI